MKNEQGITLVELIITVSVIGILVAALAFSFQGWMGAYSAENQMKNIYVDLMNTRTRAMQRNRIHFVSLTTTQYTIYEDTYDATVTANPDGDGVLQTASDSQFLLKNLNQGYPITWENSGNPQPQIQFSRKGMANAKRVICSNTKADTDYNCIKIEETTISTGKLTTKIPDAGACNATNCVTK
jgi:prepilin-type N-terminal cleavage/methylation domain-containing protein